MVMTYIYVSCLMLCFVLQIEWDQKNQPGLKPIELELMLGLNLKDGKMEASGSDTSKKTG